MKLRANSSIYWPSMSAAITNTRLNCRKCTEISPSQTSEPLITTAFPEWPFQLLSTDYFFIELHSYLVVADRYSGWLTIYYFKPGEANHTTLINIFRNLFVDFGVPDEISSDGGRQFMAMPNLMEALILMQQLGLCCSTAIHLYRIVNSALLRFYFTGN